MNNKSVAVVGGAGFLGSHLVEHLIETGNKVLVLDNLISGRKEFVHKEATFKWCDITHSESELTRVLKQADVEYVFNYAAMPYVPDSYERPLHVFDINARGALMVMNAAQEAGVRGILQVSSAEIYGDAKEKVNEESPARPHSTYGASKLAIDALVQARWREAKTPCVALRQFNCLGERDVLHPYVIPEIIEQLYSNNGTEIRLGNNTFRDFIYAGDAVTIAVELLEKHKFGQVFNLGSQEGVKIYDLAKKIGKVMTGQDITVIPDIDKMRPWDIAHLQSDNKKIYSVVKRRPHVSFNEALARTIESYLYLTKGKRQ